MPPAVVFTLLLLSAAKVESAAAPSVWSVYAYGGKWTDTRFVHIAFRGRTEFHPSYIWVLGGSRQVHDFGRHLGSEVEANFAGHTGLQHHWEVNSAFLLRWRTFPWDRYVDTSLAYGLGLSWAARPPAIEEQFQRPASQLLLSMPAELTFAPPNASPWEAMLRIHHRSGAFGIFKDAGGSNFLSLGLRYRF